MIWYYCHEPLKPLVVYDLNYEVIVVPIEDSRYWLCLSPEHTIIPKVFAVLALMGVCIRLLP